MYHTQEFIIALFVDRQAYFNIFHIFFLFQHPMYFSQGATSVVLYSTSRGKQNFEVFLLNMGMDCDALKAKDISSAPW